MDRLAQSLRGMQWEAGKKAGLSPIQVQLLLFLRYHQQALAKVSYLASEFDVTKATISESLRNLEKKRLVEKCPDVQDARSHRLVLTPKGREQAEALDAFAFPLQRSVDALDETQKKALYEAMLSVMHQLVLDGKVHLQRMCFQCRHYRAQSGRHYCQLLEQVLPVSNLRLDCPEFEAARIA